MTKKKKKLMVLVALFALLVFSFTMVELSLPLRVSILKNILKRDNCNTISSDGKWLRCSDNYHLSGAEPKFYIYSTDLPFRKFQINIPPLNSMKEGLYKAWDWSVNGNNIYLRVIRTSRSDEKDFCIVEVHPDGSYNVGCYADGNQESGQEYWSISQERLLYSTIHSDGKYELLLFDTQVNIDDRILTEKIIDPRENEIFIRDNIIWDENNIFIWIGYQYNNASRTMWHTDRSVVFRLSLKDGELSEVLDMDGDLELVSINSKGKDILLMDGGDSIGKRIQVRNMINGELLHEIPVTALNGEKVLSYYGICLFECRKSLIGLTSERTGSVLIWNWKSMDYTLYTNKSYSLGILSKYDGFLCEKTRTSDTIVYWYKICR
jgi:hypothetical protein